MNIPFYDTFNCDKRPPRAGWAGGNYSNVCHICKQIFLGDKRAFTCAPCAYKEPIKKRQTHELKELPEFFEAILRGEKTFEIRYNGDRTFNKGDFVILKEYKILSDDRFYTGREINKQISYVTSFQQQPDYVVFGIIDI
jgi:hypothetical protein